MWIAEDLTDRIFGRLTVIGRAPNGNYRSIRWACRCECGKESVVAAGDLQSGHTRSCGCSRIHDLTGRTFGKLTVLRLDRVSRKKAFWRCRCACGNEIAVRSAHLLSGNTKACGCQHFHDLTGRVFGRLTVLRRAPNVGRRTRWIVQCGCGSPEKPVGADCLIDGRTISCGCHRAVSIGNRLRTHGRTHTREYRIWCNMRRRCEDPNNPAYSNYGGRGITVAPEFQTFEGFFACVGLSNGLSLDRINNDLGYSPSNVRWADRVTQGRNRRSNRLITFNGKTQPLSAWAAEMGLSDRTLAQRVDSWPLEKAMTAPKNSSIRRAVRYAHDGKNLTLAEWAELTGVPKERIRRRLGLFWPFGLALTLPKNARRPRGASTFWYWLPRP
jgi:hypothetical protein